MLLAEGECCLIQAMPLNLNLAIHLPGGATSCALGQRLQYIRQDVAITGEIRNVWIPASQSLALITSPPTSITSPPTSSAMSANCWLLRLADRRFKEPQAAEIPIELSVGADRHQGLILDMANHETTHHRHV